MAKFAPAAETAAVPKNIHFLSRLSFGPSRAALEQVENLGWQEVLEIQLDHHSIDTSGIEGGITAVTETLKLSPIQLVEMNEPKIREQLVRELTGSTLYRQMYSPAQLFERMVEFWSDHFNIDLYKENVSFFKVSDDRDAVRPRAMSTFRELLHANARSPAMLLYLDNYTNTKSAPNENYARELMELHTMGVDGGYTEQDVAEVARAFTGWTIDKKTLEFKFSVFKHDWGPKTVLGTTLNIDNARGIKAGEAVLDLLASHPATARFVCGKMIRRFVSDGSHPELLDEMTLVFSQTDGDIKQLLRTIFHSTDFWSGRGKKMKRPLDLVTSIVRRLGIDAGEDLMPDVYSRLNEMGQAPFSWHTPDGYPDTAEYWTNTASLASRWKTAAETASYIPQKNIRSYLAGANTPNSIIRNMALALIDRELGQAEHMAFKQEIFSSLPADKTVPGNPVVSARLVATGLLASRHFQMR